MELWVMQTAVTGVTQIDHNVSLITLALWLSWELGATAGKCAERFSTRA